MSDEPDNLVLRYSRRIDERLDRVGTRLTELVGRVDLLEQAYANLSRRIDAVETPLERIERGLDLISEHAS